MDFGVLEKIDICEPKAYSRHQLEHNKQEEKNFVEFSN